MFSGLQVFYAVYSPSVRDLSLQSMLHSSLQLGITDSDQLCSLCNCALKKETSLSVLPNYLNIAISRTFFNETTHALLKDCSHVYINPILTLSDVDVLCFVIRS